MHGCSLYPVYLLAVGGGGGGGSGGEWGVVFAVGGGVCGLAQWYYACHQLTNSPTCQTTTSPTFSEGKLLHEEYMRRVCVALELYTTIS